MKRVNRRADDGWLFSILYVVNTRTYEFMFMCFLRCLNFAVIGDANVLGTTFVSWGRLAVHRLCEELHK